MRLLICLLLSLTLTAPAFADDWDGDRVVRKNRKAKSADENKEKTDKKDSPKEAEKRTLGMYFGNGDEFLESGAPRESREAPETEHKADPTENSVDQDRPHSAILGARHKPPVFFEEPDPESEGAELETDQPEATEPEASQTEAPEVTEAVEPTDSQGPIEPVETSQVSEIDDSIELPAPETLESAAVPVEKPEVVDPDSGLARYSSYPAMQGVGKSKREKADEQEAEEVPADEAEDEESEEQSRPRRGGIRMHDPDTW